RGPSVDGNEIGDRGAHGLERLLDRFLRNVRLDARYLELRPVGKLRLLLHGDGRGEPKALVGRRRHVVAVLRLGDRADARTGGRAADPAADVALDRLAVEPLTADPRHQHRHRHLAAAKTGNPKRLREVGRRVVDGVLYVLARDFDVEPDAAVGELL